ncbi:MAG: beta-xylosidase, partial [Candidatus Nanohaloarchaea archaeon]|nr:beta-xylosidase [Candidatus Nanohaloarchaea archaeon]
TDGRIPRGTSGTGDDNYAQVPTVIKDNGTYKMWYTGKDGSNNRIYMATSPNGTFWTKVNN